MSKKGIQHIVWIFSQIQEARIELLSGDNEDLLLGQILNKGHEAMKDDFTRHTATGGSKKKRR